MSNPPKPLPPNPLPRSHPPKQRLHKTPKQTPIPPPTPPQPSKTPTQTAAPPQTLPDGALQAVAVLAQGVGPAITAHVAAHLAPREPGILTLANASALLTSASASFAGLFPLPALPEPQSDLIKVSKTFDGTRGIPTGAPQNTRRVREGYWLGSKPEKASEIKVLHDAGIRVIISAVGIDDAVTEAMEKHGIQHLSIFFGRKFPAPGKILKLIDSVPPEAVYLHCEYGGDRSGVLMAFLLSVRHGWKPDHALLAMTIPNQKDVDGLVEVLNDHGLYVTPAEMDKYLSVYSGRFGGLKIRNSGYKTLVKSTISAMGANGVAITDPPSQATEAAETSSSDQ